MKGDINPAEQKLLRWYILADDRHLVWLFGLELNSK